ncbi:MAG: aromatic-ring-hydroxylating dioxygenase subunit beta [Myxococcales bacterium]|nr:aromatic-ring-hydroxylating dioxygenase subunit beta [Myxococcales bacterium]
MTEAREAIQDLYDFYVDALDGGEWERWPELFTEVCRYEVVPRENFDRGLPLALIRCESRAMLRDRVQALRRTSMYAPHYLRHVVSHPRVRADGDHWRVRANVAVFQTRVDAPTEILAVGRYEDLVVREGDRFLFRERICVLDSELVPNSLVVPI